MEMGGQCGVSSEAEAAEEMERPSDLLGSERSSCVQCDLQCDLRFDLQCDLRGPRGSCLQSSAEAG